MGVIFTGMGLANKDKWEENKRPRSDMTVGEKKLQMIAIAFLSALFLAGVVAYFLAEKGLV